MNNSIIEPERSLRNEVMYPSLPAWLIALPLPSKKGKFITSGQPAEAGVTDQPRTFAALESETANSHYGEGDLRSIIIEWMRQTYLNANNVQFVDEGIQVLKLNLTPFIYEADRVGLR